MFGLDSTAVTVIILIYSTSLAGLVPGLIRYQLPSRFRYALLWGWFVAVTLTVALLYVVSYGFVLRILGLDDLPESATAWDVIIIEYLAPLVFGVLVWWRAVKVLVLHGCPFTVAHDITGSEPTLDAPVSTRKVKAFAIWGKAVQTESLHHPGMDRAVKHAVVHFIVVLRAHPSSDKLVRYRMEYLLVGLPWQTALQIEESRWTLSRMPHRDDRHSLFCKLADPQL